MNQIDLLLGHLESRTGYRPAKSGGGWAARCPAHDDDAPSLSVREGRDGRVLVKCHAGCDVGHVVGALGLSLSDLFPDNADQPRAKQKRPRRLGRIVATHDYADSNVPLAFQVVRYDPKDFRQRHPDGHGGWQWGRGGYPPILYRLPEAEATAHDGGTVFVVEGEKDVDRLASLGLVATCNCGGASRDGDRPKWRADLHTAPLSGAHVVVLPDNDGPGRAHAEAAARSLVSVAASVRVVALPGLPAKGDVSDWLDAGGTVDRLRQFVQETPEYAPSNGETSSPPASPLGVCLADVEAEHVRWAWPRWLAAGKLHVFDGDPGMGKSTILAGIAASFTAGTPLPDGTAVPPEYRGAVVVLTAEDDPATTIRPRMEAAGADVTRVSVVATVPSDDGHGRIPAFPSDVPLILDHCRAIGARLLVVDPVTAYLGDVNSHRDSDVRGALAPLAAEAEAAGVAVVLVRHLNKGTGGSALYRGGGSIAFSGLARVVWLVGKDPEAPDGRALAVSKNNLAPFPETIGYELVSEGPFGVGRARWLGPRTLSADDLVRPPASPASTPAQDEAADYLVEALACGDRRARDLYAEAEAVGISERTLKRAKSRLHVKAEQRVGDDGDRAWWWTLPEGQGAKASDAGPQTPYAGDGAAGIAPQGAVSPQEANSVASCDDAAPCPDRGPLHPAEGLLTGQSVLTPHGPGHVLAAPQDGRVSVEVDGLAGSYPLHVVTPTEAPF